MTQHPGTRGKGRSPHGPPLRQPRLRRPPRPAQHLRRAVQHPGREGSFPGAAGMLEEINAALR